MLHRFATFVAGCTVLLVLAGSLVTSTGSGLSVPDWPTTYGWNMFTFPPSKWVGGILYEHGHRLIASTVGFLTIVLAAWLWPQEPRRWMRWLGVAALGAVIAQGVLGGLTVLFFLPAAVSTAHAGLAEIFFCMTVAIALFTSPRWIAGYGRDRRPSRTNDCACARAATTTTALDLRPDSGRRHDAAHGRRPRHSRFSADVRTPVADALGSERSRSISPIASARSSSRWRSPRPPRWSGRAPRDAPRADAARRAARRARRRAGHAGRAHGAQPARRLDQQRARRLRRAGADDIAGADAADLAHEVRGTVRDVRLKPAATGHGCVGVTRRTRRRGFAGRNRRSPRVKDARGRRRNVRTRRRPRERSPTTSR